MGKGQCFQQIFPKGQLGIPLKIYEPSLLPHTIHKDQLKMNHIPIVNGKTIRLLEENIGEKSSEVCNKQLFKLDILKIIKEKMNKLGIEKLLLFFKRHY